MTKSKESAPTQGKRARLTRRKFLSSGAIVGAALVVSPALARTSNNAAPAVKSFELEETTIAELQAGMQSGKWSARELVRKYLARIAEIDKRGPTVNAIIELNPDAEGIADALDRERKGGHTRGPLHGIPVLIKDNIDTADRMKTTAGSLALAASTPPRDSFAAERLRAAGAVIMRRVVGADAAGRRATLMCWIAIRAAQAPVRASQSRRISAPSPSARRRTARSSVLRLRTRSSASSPRSVSSAARASFRLRTAKTPQARWRAPLPTPPRCSQRSRALTRATPRRKQVAVRHRRITRAFSMPMVYVARASVWRENFSASTMRLTCC